MNVKKMMLATTLAMSALAAGSALAQGTRMNDAQMIERGRYIAKIAGCNDCHTPGYAASGGKLAERDWLTGDALGYSGPWGTSYASNLRQQVAGLTERQWLARARQGPMRPPMPGLSLQAMAPQDLKAIYRYIRWLGPRGEPAPPPLPPGVAPQGPVVVFPAP